MLGAGLIGLSWIDLRTKRLPRQIIYVTAVDRRTAALPGRARASTSRERIWTMLLGAGCALAFMAIVYVVSRGGMGDGDVRLSPLLGAYLGWLNPGLVAVGLFLGFLVRRGRRRGDDGGRYAPDARPPCRSVRSSHSARSLPCSSVSGASTCSWGDDQSTTRHELTASSELVGLNCTTA